MLKARFFSQIGMFVVDHFLDEASCRRLCMEMRSSALAPATVGQDGRAVVDSGVRAAGWATVSPRSKARVRERLRGLIPELQRHFAVSLGDCQAPQFLIYRAGGFYNAHSDSGGKGDLPSYVRERVLSVVLFLNTQTAGDDPEGYRGGALTFRGLMKDPRLASRVYPLLGERGLLVVFPSDVVHGVAPVISGERYTVVSWFV